MIDKEKVKELVKDDKFIRTAASGLISGPFFYINKTYLDGVIDRIIKLTIEKTLQEVEGENETLRQKLIEDLDNVIEYAAEVSLTKVKEMAEEIIDKRFGVKEEE